VLALCRKVGDRSSTAILLSNLGAIALESGDPQEALRLIQEGAALFREVNHPQAVIQATTMLSAVHRALGRFDEARNELHEALDEALRRHLEHLVPYALFELSQLHAAIGEVELALELMEWVVANPSTIGEHKRDGLKLIAELTPCLSPAALKMIHQRSEELSPRLVLARLRSPQ
jgi:tetratricopeptide (TPR) repeat protein